MITRAIITDLDLKSSKAQVHIPLLDGITNNNSNAHWASIIYTPGLDINYKIGDVVEVGFEDNDVGKPIIIGFLKLVGDVSSTESRLYGNFNELNVANQFNAPTNTIIGKTDYQKLFDSVEAYISTLPDITAALTELQNNNNNLISNIEDIRKKLPITSSTPLTFDFFDGVSKPTLESSKTSTYTSTAISLRVNNIIVYIGTLEESISSGWLKCSGLAGVIFTTAAPANLEESNNSVNAGIYGENWETSNNGYAVMRINNELSSSINYLILQYIS